MTQYSIEAVLKATGAESFAKSFGSVSKQVESMGKNVEKSTSKIKSFTTGVGKIAAGIGATKLLSGAFNTLRSSMDGAISRVDTLNRFPKMMEQMGFSAEESEASIQKLSDGIQGLPTTLDSVAATAQQIAILTGDIEGATDTTLALNNAFLASGSSSADAERGLTQYVQMLSKGEVDMQSWRSLQETMGVALNDTAKAFGFAGESAQNDLYDALKDGNITFDQFNDKLIEINNSTGGFAERALTASAGIQTSFQNIRTAVVTGLANMIQTVDEAMQEGGFGSIADNLDKVKVAVQNSFKGMNEMVSGVIEVLMVIRDAFSGDMGGLQSIMETVVPRIATWMRTRLPELLQTGGEFINNLVSGVFQMLPYFYELWGQVTSTVIALLIGNLPQMLEMGVQILTTLADGIGSSIERMTETVLLVVNGIIHALMESLPNMLESGLNILMAIVQGIVDNLPKVTQAALSIVDVFLEFITSSLPLILSMGIEMLFELVDGIINALPEVANAALEVVETLLAYITSNLPGIVAMGVEMLTKLVSGISDRLPEVIRIATEIIVEFLNIIIRSLPDIISAGVDILLSLVDGIFQMFGDLERAVNNATDIIMDTFSSLSLVDIGKQIIRGLWSGITSMGSWLYNKVAGFADGILGWFAKKMDIHSPSRLFRDEIGKMIPEGIAVGIEANGKSVVDSANQITNMLIESLHAPRFGIAGDIARSNAQVNSIVRHEVTRDNEPNLKQPLEINLHLGDRNYRAFVADIDREIGRRTQLEERWY